MNPAAAVLFFGLVLTIVTYSALDHTGTMGRLGTFGPLLPLPAILGLMWFFFRGMKRLKRRASRIRIKGPLFVRKLMQDCLRRTCGPLEKRLNAPEISTALIFNDILLDKMLLIDSRDCFRFSDIHQQIENSGLKGTEALALAGFLESAETYTQQDLPDEIRQVSDTVSRNRTDLKDLMEKLKAAHQTLCTGRGNILALLPPNPKKVEKILSTYRYQPPTAACAQRMAFALETLDYLRATRYANVNPIDRQRYNAVAAQVIPELATALKDYKKAWQDLVDAYERP